MPIADHTAIGKRNIRSVSHHPFIKSIGLSTDDFSEPRCIIYNIADGAVVLSNVKLSR